MSHHKLYQLLCSPAALSLALCALCAVTLACGRAKDVPAWDKPVLKVLDINIWSGLDYKGYVTMGEYESAQGRALRYRALVRQIKALDADIIGVHEANKLPGYIDTLAADLDCDAVWHVGVGGVRAGVVGLPWNLREGDAILAKRGLGLEPVKRLQLSGGPVGNFFTFHFEDATQIIGAKVTVKGKPVYLFSTHWHASPLDDASLRAKLAQLAATRKASVEEIKSVRDEIAAGMAWRMDESNRTLAFVKELAGANTALLFGDFNSTIDMPEIQQLDKEGFVNTFTAMNREKEAHTWDPRRNENQKKHYAAAPPNPSLMEELDFWADHQQRRIDHIFIRQGAQQSLAPRASRVVLDELVDGVHASDHFGIYTEFDVK